jgi:hypothetical protein
MDRVGDGLVRAGPIFRALRPPPFQATAFRGHPKEWGTQTQEALGR